MEVMTTSNHEATWLQPSKKERKRHCYHSLGLRLFLYPVAPHCVSFGIHNTILFLI